LQLQLNEKSNKFLHKATAEELESLAESDFKKFLQKKLRSFILQYKKLLNSNLNDNQIKALKEDLGGIENIQELWSKTKEESEKLLYKIKPEELESLKESESKKFLQQRERQKIRSQIILYQKLLNPDQTREDRDSFRENLSTITESSALKEQLKDLSKRLVLKFSLIELQGKLPEENLFQKKFKEQIINLKEISLAEVTATETSLPIITREANATISPSSNSLSSSTPKLIPTEEMTANPIYGNSAASFATTIQSRHGRSPQERKSLRISAVQPEVAKLVAVKNPLPASFVATQSEIIKKDANVANLRAAIARSQPEPEKVAVSAELVDKETINPLPAAASASVKYEITAAKASVISAAITRSQPRKTENLLPVRASTKVGNQLPVRTSAKYEAKAAEYIAPVLSASMNRSQPQKVENSLSATYTSGLSEPVRRGHQIQNTKESRLLPQNQVQATMLSRNIRKAQPSEIGLNTSRQGSRIIDNW
jgi:hypothetical protein